MKTLIALLALAATSVLAQTYPALASVVPMLNSRPAALSPPIHPPP